MASWYHSKIIPRLFTELHRLIMKSRQSNIPFVWEQGPWPIFPNGDNSALRGPRRLFECLVEGLRERKETKSTTKSLQGAPSTVKVGSITTVTYYERNTIMKEIQSLPNVHVHSEASHSFSSARSGSRVASRILLASQSGVILWTAFWIWWRLHHSVYKSRAIQ